MELKELRDEIDRIDDEMAELFEKRASIACQVAEYKRAHNMAVYQGSREEEVLQKVSEAVSPELRDGAKLLFTNLMDISKCRQQQLLTEIKPFIVSPATDIPPTPARNSSAKSAI